jgi:23S rRNA (guanine745-N1)-methyltransferase
MKAMATPTGKKRTRAAGTWEKNEHLLRCPHCSSDMHFTGATARCTEGHAFDLSRKGTLHLLTSPHKTHYDRTLFEARQRIIATGMYDPAIDAIAEVILEQGNITSLLDAGCGEGSHLRRLKERFPPDRSVAWLGVDIAKEGIEVAGTGEPDALFAVADLARLPFADDAFDAILNFLSPANYKSFGRVLRPGGRLYKVVPGPDYLQEIRLLRKDADRQPYDNEQVIDQFLLHMKKVDRRSLHYTFPLEGRHLTDLVAMTPLGWHDGDQLAKELQEHYCGKITIDLTLLIGTDD